MSRIYSRTVTWDFADADPARVWQAMADTARFNEAAGLPLHAIEEIEQDDGAMRFFAKAKKGPFALAWEERPVNWVWGQWFEHTRDFSKGPLKRLTARFELHHGDAGLAGDYTIEAEAANAVGVGLLASGTFFNGAFKTFDKLAASTKAFAQGEQDEPFDTPVPALAAPAKARLQAAMDKIEASPHGHGLAQKLGAWVTSAQNVDLWHMRPLVLARKWDKPDGEVIDLSLQAVRAGLLDLSWDLLCPRCRVAKVSTRGLDALPEGAHCGTCNIDYGRDFSKNVEAVFKPAPSIRTVDSGDYCLFGPMSTPHIKLQITLEPGESRAVAVQLAPGPYRLRTLEVGDEEDLDYAAGPFPEIYLAPGPAIEARAGQAVGTVTLTNQAERRRTLIVEERAWFADALTADRVTARQTFRDLFSDVALRPGDEMGIAKIALMFTDLKGSTALYSKVGDAAAYHLVREHFAFMTAIIRRENGALVKTIGDAVMAAFIDAGDAVRAALAVQQEVTDFNAKFPQTPIRIKMGVHAGPSIAVTLNERLDYFGSTVNLAARLQGESRGGDLVMSKEVVEDPEVQGQLEGHSLAEESAQLRGFDAPVRFYRLML